MHTIGSSQGCLVHFPGKTVLSRQQAVRYLGISHMAFLTMSALRCAPRPRQLDGRTVYREEELENFKAKLLLTVGVSHADTPYQPAAALRPPPATAHTQPNAPIGHTQQEQTHLDPLMQLLARATIRHRIILLTLWSMIIVGGLSTLILF